MTRQRDTARAAARVVTRRGELGISQITLAEAAGVDVKTIYNLESGSRWPHAKTRNRIEAELGWMPGDLMRVAEGAEPTVRAPALAMASHGRIALPQLASPTPPVPAGEARTVPKWLTSELDRRGIDADDVAVTVETLRDIAERDGYTLAELLLEAGLVDGRDLVVDQRLTPRAREALADYDNDIRRVTSSPFLSPRDRKELEADAAQARQDAIERHFGDR